MLGQPALAMCRRWIGVLVASALIATVGQIQFASDVSAVASTATSELSDCPNSTDSSIPVPSETRCVAGSSLNTRARLNPACLVNGPLLAAAVYNARACGGVGRGVEYIAHARAVARLNASVGGTATGISPNIQWETRIPSTGERPDIVYYDSASATGPVQIIEVKGTWERNYPNVETQLRGYIERFPTSHTKVPGNELAARGLANDTFTVRTTKICPGKSIGVNQKFRTSSPAPGLLIVDKYAETDCPNADDENDYREVKQGEQEEHHDPHFPPPLINVPPDNTGDPDEPDFDDIPHTPGLITWPTPDPSTVPAPTMDRCDWICITAETVTTSLVWSFVAGQVLYRFVSSISPAFLSGLLGFLDEFNRGSLYGDPHITTLDGLGYDFQTVGEFHLLKAEAYDMDVQSRFGPLGASTTVSRTEATVFKLNGRAVQIDIDANVLVDGENLEIPDGGYTYFGDGAAIFRRGTTFTAFWPGSSDRPVLNFQISKLLGASFVSFHLPDGTQTTGLMGNNDRNRTNEFRLSDGTPLVSEPSPEAIHGSYADSWRVTNANSLFQYGPGEDTSTFTDPSFPSDIFDVNNYPASEQAQAEATCREAGVQQGGPLRGCIYDILASGSDDFVGIAAEVTQPSASASDLFLDTNGDLSVDFETPSAPNFAYRTTATDPATTRFAGPLHDSQTYGFTLLDIPPHAQMSIAFDLIVMGDWTTASHRQKVGLDVVGQTVWSTELAGNPATGQPTGEGLGTPTSIGNLAGGVPYRTYRIAVPAQGIEDAADAELSFTDGIGVAAHTFGVDNLSITTDAEPPDVFNVNLTTAATQVSNGVPGSGAGNIETRAAHDAYRFTISGTKQSVALNMKTCQSGNFGVRWKLIKRDSGQLLNSGGCANDSTFTDLTAGDYQLEVVPGTGDPGTYSLELMVVPPPQVFTVPISETPTSVSNGVPATGAGVLETVAARDVYRFTVPSGGRSITLDNKTSPGGSAVGSEWKLVDQDSAETIQTNLGVADATFELDEGNYELEYTSAFGGSGEYSFDLMVVPEPQIFNLALSTTPITVSNGQPSSGAGNLETVAAVDIYRFTVPSAGGSVALDNQSCPSNGGSSWRLVDRATGDEVQSRGCAWDETFDDLDPGDYQLEYRSVSGNKGAYSFTLALVPQPQVFTLGLSVTPFAVSDGVPSAGAGRMELPASKDSYKFVVPEGGASIAMDFKSCITGTGVQWELVNLDADTVTKSGPCSPLLTTIVPDLNAANYELRFTSSLGATGTYAFDFMKVPDPDIFNLTLSGTPTHITNGSPGPGAGNLETKAAKDIYRFTVPSGGATILLDNKTCAGIAGSKWRLVNRSTNAQIENGGCSSDHTFTALPAGDYQLEVVPDGSTGTYSLDLMTVLPPDTFDLSLSTTSTSVSNGVPGPGAGNIESVAAKDIYRFTVPAGTTSVVLDNKTCPENYVLGHQWKLVNRTTGAKISENYCVTDQTFTGLAAGDYQLEIVSAFSKIGTYSFDIKLAS